jgi:hypothetical protein
MAKSNREGEPGLPGEEGTVTQGGKGGAGGKGGYGEKAHELWIIIFVLIVAVALSVGTGIAIKKISDNTARIETNLRSADEQHASTLKLIEQTDYRICVRQMVNRAVLDNFRGTDKEDTDSLRPLPLYDCTPDLSGKLPILLTAEQAKVFRRQIAQNAAP